MDKGRMAKRRKGDDSDKRLERGSSRNTNENAAEAWLCRAELTNLLSSATQKNLLEFDSVRPKKISTTALSKP
jgi:hypothetical protein